MAFAGLISCREREEEMEQSPSPWPDLRLPSLPNFRDVAGPQRESPYLNVHGESLRPRVFFRSGWLNPDDADFQRLRALGIQTVYDVRVPNARHQQPDRIPDGIDYVLSPLWEPPAGMELPSEEQMLRLLVTDPEARQRTAHLLEQMSRTQSAQLFHCGRGDVLTGWIAALLHSMAEVPLATIVQDYLLSNERLSAHATGHRQTVAPTLHGSHLQAALQEAEVRFGSMRHFISEGLHLSAAAQERLRERLLT